MMMMNCLSCHCEACFKLIHFDGTVQMRLYQRPKSTKCKGPFIATQLNSTRRRVELSCVAINAPLLCSNSRWAAQSSSQMSAVASTIHTPDNSVLWSAIVSHRTCRFLWLRTQHVRIMQWCTVSLRHRNFSHDFLLRRRYLLVSHLCLHRHHRHRRRHHHHQHHHHHHILSAVKIMWKQYWTLKMAGYQSSQMADRTGDPL